VPALVRRIRLSGGEPETLSASRRLILSVFYLPDGRLAWTVMEPQETGYVPVDDLVGRVSRVNTRVEVLSATGIVSELRTFEAFSDRVIASPTGDGLYCRCYAPLFDLRRATEHLVFLPLRQGADLKREIVPLSRVVWLHNMWNFREPLRFALTSDNKSLYVGDAGRLWKIEVASGVREPVPFTARVRQEIQDPVTPRKPDLGRIGSSTRPRVINEPRLSPDGRTLVFGAAGYLWQQRLDGGSARRLFEGTAYELEPAFSPDGRRLAYLHSKHGRDEIRLFDFESGEARSLASEPSWGLSWSPDGQRLVFEDSLEQVVALTVSDGQKAKLAGATSSRPHFSADGRWLYISEAGQFYRIRLAAPAEKEAMTRLDRPLRDGIVSPKGNWLAFRRNSEIWVAKLAREPVENRDIRLLSAEGTEGYAFTPDGSALIYAIGNRVWRHRLADGAREEIPIRLELQRPTPPPLLLRRVRVLDYAAGGFGQERSVYIDQGRIRWMGTEGGRNIARDAVIVDAGGRFAIPGLFDMHTHHFSGTPETEPEAFIAYGVTSIRDVGSPLHWFGAVADRLEFSGEPGPRAFYSGDTFHYRAPANVSSVVAIRDEEGARSYVRRWKAQGAHFIKAYSSLSWRLRRAVAEEARRQGLPVAGHGLSVEEITKSVILGFASLEHFNTQSRAYDDILLMIVAAGTRWDPTLEAMYGNDLLLRNEPERLLDPKLRAFMPESSIRDAQTVYQKTGNYNMLRGLWGEWLSSLQSAHRLGVKLLAGTDTDGGRLFPGITLHWELEHLVEARLTPLEVLRIATQQAAEAVGAQDDLGTLEPGKFADIVLLDKNPLEDIKNTQTIWRVLKGGWLFDPDKLRPVVPVVR
jgi:imidazolonepropionase-like amidohydrolase